MCIIVRVQVQVALSAVNWVQGGVSELVGASLVLAARYGLDQPQPLLDPAALAALINVPIGKLCYPMSAALLAGHVLHS